MRAWKVKSRTSIEDNTTCSADQLNKSTNRERARQSPTDQPLTEKSESWRTIWRMKLTACEPTCVSKQGGRDLLKIGGPSRARSRQRFHELQSFRAPSATRLQGNNNRVALVALEQFRVLALFVWASCRESSAILSRCSRDRAATVGESTPQCDINGKLSSVVERKTRSQNFDRRIVRCLDDHIHVSQLGVTSHSDPSWAPHWAQCFHVGWRLSHAIQAPCLPCVKLDPRHGEQLFANRLNKNDKMYMSFKKAISFTSALISSFTSTRASTNMRHKDQEQQKQQEKQYKHFGRLKAARVGFTTVGGRKQRWIVAFIVSLTSWGCRQISVTGCPDSSLPLSMGCGKQ